MQSRQEAARGIVRIANNNMVNAIKLISVNRGHDPRDFTLIAFGGGGGMHACALARELGIKKVVIPKQSSVFSAWGMLLSDLRRDYLQTQIVDLSPKGTYPQGGPIGRLAHRNRNDLVFEPPFLNRPSGILLTPERQGILFLPGDAELFGHVFGGDSHVVAVENVQESVVDHTIDQRPVIHAVPPARSGEQEGRPTAPIG